MLIVWHFTWFIRADVNNGIPFFPWLKSIPLCVPTTALPARRGMGTQADSPPELGEQRCPDRGPGGRRSSSAQSSFLSDAGPEWDSGSDSSSSVSNFEATSMPFSTQAMLMDTPITSVQGFPSRHILATCVSSFCNQMRWDFIVCVRLASLRIEVLSTLPIHVGHPNECFLSGNVCDCSPSSIS